MTDLAQISNVDLAAEMRRRALAAKAELYAPLRDTYAPLHDFMDNEQALSLSQVLALVTASRPQGDPDSPVEQNLSALRRVLANTKTVWDATVGIAFDDEAQPDPV